MAEVSVLLSDGLHALYARCRRETGYRPANLPCDLEAMRRVLASPPSEDFDRLCDLRRPDLTVEAFVLSLDDRERLFSVEELADRDRACRSGSRAGPKQTHCGALGWNGSRTVDRTSARLHRSFLQEEVPREHRVDPGCEEAPYRIPG